MHRLANEPRHPDLPAMIDGLINWLRTLTVYAANNRLGIADFKAMNVGYRDSDCSWYCEKRLVQPGEDLHRARCGLEEDEVAALCV